MTYLGVQISAKTAGLTSAISLKPSMAATLRLWWLTAWHWISISKVTLEHLQKLKICPTVSTRHHLLGSSLWVSDTSHDSPCKNQNEAYFVIVYGEGFPHLTRSPQYCMILTRGWGASPPASWSTSPQSLSSGPLDLPRQRVALKISKIVTGVFPQILNIKSLDSPTKARCAIAARACTCWFLSSF